MTECNFIIPDSSYGRKSLEVWTKLEAEGMKLNNRLGRSNLLNEAEAEKLHKEAEDFSGRLAAALAGAKVQKETLMKWVTENMP